MTPTQKRAVAHYYRTFRENMTRTAESAYASARSHVNFLARLKVMCADAKRRSRAAKRGHATRRNRTLAA